MSGGRPLIFAAWMGIFVYGYLNAMLGIVLPNLMAKLKLDKSQAGTFFMISSVGLLVAALPAGLTMDAFGTKLVVCLGLLLVATAFWGLGSIDSSKLLYPLAFVLGLGGSMVVAGENTAMSMVNSSQREVAANLLNLFFGVGAFVAPFIVMPVLKRRGFSGVLKASSLLTIAILVLHVVLSFPQPPAADAFPLARAGALLMQPKLLLLMFLVFLYVGTEFSVWSWTVTFFTTERGYDQKIASRMISAFALAMIAGRWSSQWTLSALGPERLLIGERRRVVCVSGWHVRLEKSQFGCRLYFRRGGIYGSDISHGLGIGRHIFPFPGWNRNQPGDNGWLDRVRLSSLPPWDSFPTKKGSHAAF